MAKYYKKVQKQLAQIKRKGAEVKVFRLPRDKNYEANIVAKLVTSGIVEML